MCSISGFIASRRLDPLTAHRLVAALLWYGAERGDQSSGVYANRTLVKRALAPSKFIELPEFKSIFTKRTRFALCHTRWPTSGGRGDAQAQPFQTGTTVTVHNGHVFQSKEVAKEWGLSKPSGVDSEVLCSFVDIYGALELPTLLEKTFGAFAIASLWRGKLYLIKERNPLSTAHIKVGGNDILVFGSTSDIIISAMKNCWLLHSHFSGSPIQENVLYEARPDGIVRLSDPPPIIPSRSFHGYNHGRSGTWHGNVFTPDSDQQDFNRSLADRALGSHCSATPNLDRAERAWRAWNKRDTSD